MTDPTRVSPRQVREKVLAGSALLVCAYDDEEKFENNHLEGAISFSDFQSRLPSLSGEQEIVFYCA